VQLSSFDQVHFKHKQSQVLSPDSHVTIGTIQQMQDAANVHWVCRHNSRHAAWPTVVLRFTSLEDLGVINTSSSCVWLTARKFSFNQAHRVGWGDARSAFAPTGPALASAGSN